MAAAILLVAVDRGAARGARQGRCARCSAAARRSRSSTSWSISVIGAIISSIVVLVLTVAVAAFCARREPRPRQRRRADRHRGRRHRDAAEPLPRDLPARLPLRHAGRSRSLCARARASARWSSRSGPGLPILRRIVIESLPILVLAGVVDLLAGITIEKRLESFLTFPALLVLVPAVPRGLRLARRDPRGADLDQAPPRHARAGPGRRGAAAIDDVMLIYVYAIPVFVFLGLSSIDRRRTSLNKASPGVARHDGREPARRLPGHDRGGGRRLLRGRRHLPVRPRPRQPRRSDRHLEPRPPGRAVAYPGDRDPGARPDVAGLGEPSDGRTTPKSEGHAVGGEGHLRAHGRPRVRVAVLRRHAHGRRGDASSRSASPSSSTRCARCACSRRARSATPSRCRACCTSCRRSSAWATPRSTSSRIVTHRLGIPPSLVADLAARRRGVAPRARPRRLRARRSLARRRRAADGGRHARRRDPARPRVAHRSRRRRAAAPRRRADPARRARGHRRGARARGRAGVARRPASRRTPRSPTSTARSTCWSR